MKLPAHLTVTRVVALKAVVGVGIASAHFLPPEVAVVISITSNLIWLFKI